MFSLIAHALKLIHTLYRTLKHDKDFLSILASFVFCLVGGTFFYTLTEGWHWLDALYFCVLTAATIGSNGFEPSSMASKIFTMLYLFTSVGLFFGIAYKILTHSVRKK